jgi:cell wall-associated NlpC family hydrolase
MSCEAGDPLAARAIVSPGRIATCWSRRGVTPPARQLTPQASSQAKELLLTHPCTQATTPARLGAAAVAAVALALPLVAVPALAQQSADGAPPTATGATGTSGPTGPSGPTDTTAGSPAPTVHLTRSQTRRLQHHVDVRADGVFGQSTRRALRRWERRGGLQADGRPDPVVLHRMHIDLTPAQASHAGDARSGHVDDPAGAGAARRAVDAATAQEGTAYSAGGNHPGGFDCSGLTSWAFAQAGVTLPRTSFDQFEVGTSVQRQDIVAGDLVFFDSAGPGASDVGIATSPARVVSATSHGVMEHASFDGYWGSHYVGARRVPTS